MRLSLKTKQVAGVTLIVGLVVVALSALHLAWIARASLGESALRGELLAHIVFQQVSTIARGDDPLASLSKDPGIRSILEAGLAYSPNVTYVAVVDRSGRAVAHSSPVLEGQGVPEQPDIRGLLARNLYDQLSAIYSDRTFEVSEPLLLGRDQIGAIRVGLSMLLVRSEIRRALGPAAVTALLALVVATVVASGFAQWLLRPIAILRTGLARLGKGETGVKLDLPADAEFGDLGRSFETVSATLAAARSTESIVDRLEDAVAVYSDRGELLFANPAMREVLGVARAGSSARALPEAHPYRPLLLRALDGRTTQGPEHVVVERGETGRAEHLVTAHALADRQGHFAGVMLVARNLAYLGQLESTLRYSRKLASLNRLLAGVAHEVKNPLNAMTIHLELLKQKLSGGMPRLVRPAGAAEGDGPGAAPPPVDTAGALRHVSVIGQEIRRLDEVVQGFLKFSRPDDLSLRPVDLRALADEVASLVSVEAGARRVAVRNECPGDLPPVQADQTLLRQALLNLAINACQAMPNGGTLTFRGRRAGQGQVEVEVEDTGTGIPPEDLGRIFNLYFTTKERGTGLGLSMVYRTVQLHDGTIEAESTVGRGTIFRIRLPQARTPAPAAASAS
jgi:signal transduction histidine kinase